jgi:hypothetical protein
MNPLEFCPKCCRPLALGLCCCVVLESAPIENSPIDSKHWHQEHTHVEPTPPINTLTLGNSAYTTTTTTTPPPWVQI